MTRADFLNWVTVAYMPCIAVDVSFLVIYLSLTAGHFGSMFNVHPYPREAAHILNHRVGKPDAERVGCVTGALPTLRMAPITGGNLASVSLTDSIPAPSPVSPLSPAASGAGKAGNRICACPRPRPAQCHAQRTLPPRCTVCLCVWVCAPSVFVDTDIAGWD